MSMSRQEAIEFLLDHYQNPRNRGPLPEADVHLTGGNPGCADRVEMWAKIGPEGHVEEVHFDGEGCTISMAAASYVTELVQGMTLDEVEELSYETLIDDLGREVVMARPTCATVGLGTLKKGLHELHMRRKASQAGVASDATQPPTRP
jgi:nitrogen fixation protein NifU and related proteins